MEVEKYSCIPFIFYIGQPENYRSSSPSDSICYFADNAIQLFDSYSKFITMNYRFDDPMQIKIRKKLSYFDKNGPVIYSAFPRYINGK